MVNKGEGTDTGSVEELTTQLTEAITLPDRFEDRIGAQEADVVKRAMTMFGEHELGRIGRADIPPPYLS